MPILRECIAMSPSSAFCNDDDGGFEVVEMVVRQKKYISVILHVSIKKHIKCVCSA